MNEPFSEEVKQANLAQILDLKRRLAERDFSEVEDLDEEGEVVDMVEAKRQAYEDKFGSAHPVLTPPHRRDTDG